MRLIELYILRRVLVVFMATLLTTIGVTWVVQLLSRINFLTTSGQSFLSLLQFSSLFIPSIIPFVMPFALVIAVALVLAAMNRDCELVVVAACGAPRRTILRPLITLAILVALICFTMSNFIAPHARLAMRAQLAQNHSDLINLLLQEGNFRQIDEGVYIEIGERHEDGSIGKLFIVDESNPEIDLHYYAIDGRVAENESGYFLILQRGEIQRVDRQSGDVSIIQFDSYSFDLSSFAPVARSITILPKDQFLSGLIRPDPDDNYYQRRPLHYMAELHRRLSSWLLPIVFVLIGLAASGDAKANRDAGIAAPFITLTLSLILYWLEEVIVDWSENDPAFLPLLYLIPLGSLTLLSIMLATGRRLSLPDFWHERLTLLFERIRKGMKGEAYRQEERQ